MTETIQQPVSEAVQDTSPSSVPPLKLSTKLAYGFGQATNGVKDNGFGFFLLLFYSQVIGVPQPVVGLAILLALAADAVSDPIVGYWSDNFRSRWGRRHPFMYFAILPMSLSYFLLWNPPAGWSDAALFWYILLLAISIRTFLTFFATPSTALAAELTDDYDERSFLFSLRYFFAWTVGNGMTTLMFFVLFPAFVTAAIPDGSFNREAYAVYGIIASILMFLAMTVCTVGTHSRIKHLKAPPPKRRLSIGKVFYEIYETLFERSFAALFVAATFGAVAAGLAASLTFYFSIYFWGFSSIQIGVLTLGTFGSAIIGSTMAPIVTRKMGKKNGATIIGLIAVLGAPLPIMLRLAGLLPPNGDPFIFWFVLITNIIDVGLIICFQILAASMMADLVEQAELKTGRRNEGVFFSAVTFVQKMVGGIGIFLGSLVLALAGLSAGADATQVTPETLTRLGMIYVPVVLSLWLAMILAISTYKIDRAAHEETLRQLAEGR